MAKDLYLYQRGKIWWARKRYKGKDHYCNCETNDRRLAQKRAKQWLDELIAQGWGEKKKYKFSDAAIRFASEHFPSLKHKTASRYKTSLNHLLDEFGELPLDEITSDRLWQFEQRRRKVASPATIGLDFRTLSILFGLADIWQWHSVNPVRSYIAKRRKSTSFRAESRKRFLSHQEEAMLLQAAPPSWGWRIIFAIETGLRKEEQFSLLQTDLRLERGVLHVRQEISKSYSREVPITERAMEAITYMRSPGSSHVCPRSDGQRFAPGTSNIWTNLQHIAKKAGIEHLRWHDLRRTCGCRLLQDRRLPLEAVRDWLGHSSVSITEKAYAFLKIDHLQEMVIETQTRVRKIGGHIE